MKIFFLFLPFIIIAMGSVVSGQKLNPRLSFTQERRQFPIEKGQLSFQSLSAFFESVNLPNIFSDKKDIRKNQHRD